MIRRNDVGQLLMLDDQEAVTQLEALCKKYNKLEVLTYIDEVIFKREHRQRQMDGIVDLLVGDEDMRREVFKRVDELVEKPF